MSVGRPSQGSSGCGHMCGIIGGLAKAEEGVCVGGERWGGHLPAERTMFRAPNHVDCTAQMQSRRSCSAWSVSRCGRSQTTRSRPPRRCGGGADF